MSVFSSGPLTRFYFQTQATFNVVPNSTGTWTNTGAKLCPQTKADISRIVELIASDFMTGTGSMLQGIPGRARATGSFSNVLAPSGVAGTAPNLDPLLTNIFGVSTNVAATSQTYTFSDGVCTGLIAAIFDESNSGSTHRFLYGGAMGSATLNYGGNGYVAIDSDGQFVYDLESDNFANEDTTGKGGLTTYPAEPGTPTFVGQSIPAFLSSAASIGGNSTVEFVSAQLAINTGRVLRYDGGKYGTAIVQGRRSAILKSLKMANSNSANLTLLKNLAASKTAVNVSLIQGGTPGYTITTTLKNVQFGDAKISVNGANVDVDFGDSPAHATALANIDDCTIALT
jgi:hypothetical protein